MHSKHIKCAVVSLFLPCFEQVDDKTWLASQAGKLEAYFVVFLFPRTCLQFEVCPNSLHMLSVSRFSRAVVWLACLFKVRFVCECLETGSRRQVLFNSVVMNVLYSSLLSRWVILTSWRGLSLAVGPENARFGTDSRHIARSCHSQFIHEICLRIFWLNIFSIDRVYLCTCTAVCYLSV